MARNRKTALWLAGVIFGLLVLFVGSSLLVQLLVDEQAIRGKLQETLARSVEGTIDFERLEVSLLPPRGTLSNISLSLPGKEMVGIAESATAYLKILPLFRGRIRFGSVEVRRPDFRVEVPEMAVEPEGQESALSPQNLAGGAYGVLSQLQGKQPDLEILIEEGRLSLTREGEPVVVLSDFDGKVGLPPDELNLDIRSASNMWESLRVSAKINPHLEGKAGIELEGFRPQWLTDLLSPRSEIRIGDSLINARIRLEMKGYPNIEGELEASAPRLAIEREKSSALLKIDELKGKAHFAEGEMRFTLDELVMGSPSLKISGRLHLDQTAPTASIELLGKEIDVNGLRDLSLSLTGDLPIVKKASEAVLGGTIDQALIVSRGKSWEDLIEPANMDISATVNRVRVRVPQRLNGYDLNLPHPVEIAYGGFTYQGTRISWKNVLGRMGNTQVMQADGTIEWGEPSRIEVALDRALLDLGEIHPWLSTMAEIPEPLKQIKSAKGHMTLTGFRLQGPLGNSEGWTFQGSGQIANLLVESPGLPGVLDVSKAGFSGNAKRLEVSGAQVALSDALLSLSGTVEGYMKGQTSLRSDFQGLVGPAAEEWISSTLELPPEIQVRAPLNFSKAGLVWEEGKETSFTGDFTVAGGPQVSLNVTHRPQEGNTLIRNLVIDGPDGRASMSMSIGGNTIDVKFRGDLTEATMKQIMEENPYLNGWIKGDFNARILKNDLMKSSVEGKIEAGDLSIIGGTESPLLVNRISIDALGNSVRVETADLAWRGMEASVNGKVGLEPQGLRVALTMASEGFTWEKVTRVIEEEKKGEKVPKGSAAQERGGIGALPVHGVIHVKAAYFQYEDLRWEPFAFDLILQGRRLVLEINEGRLCGIPTEATVKVSPEPMELEAEADVEKRELGKTLSCFLDTRLATGQFDFTGEIAARGASENLLRNLQGQFTINAGEGRIYRFGLLAKILSVVNVTEIFKGRVPDLGKGLGYKSARFIGKIEDGKVELEEGYIDGNSMGLAFKGGMDIPTEQIDMTVLVTPLKTVDTILENIPILGSILGENFIAVPVRVRGDISDPSVTPLSPSAVGAGLLGILERTLKLPGKLIQPLIPGNKG